MKILPINHKRRGYDCLQLARTDKWALYTVSNIKGMRLGYEVFRVKVSKPRTFPDGTSTEAGEAYPGDNLFGRSAWFCTSITLCLAHVEKEPERAALSAACCTVGDEAPQSTSNRPPKA